MSEAAEVTVGGSPSNMDWYIILQLCAKLVLLSHLKHFTHFTLGYFL